MGDRELLHHFQAERSEAAFTALVKRYAQQVYSAAIRQVGSHDLAQDVAQAVFLDLAKQAAGLAPSTHLAAWLQVISRRRAIDLIRKEARRRKLEGAAANEQAPPGSGSEEAHWAEIAPVLDAALCDLSDEDREAILRRFFENQSFKQIGLALRASEDAAQKRVSRALERLRSLLLKRGVNAASGLTIGSAISTYGRVPMIPGLTDSLAAGAAKGVSFGSGAGVPFARSPISSLRLTAIATIAITVVGLFQLRIDLQLQAALAHLRSETDRWKDETDSHSAPRTVLPPPEAAIATAASLGELEPEAAILAQRIRTMRKWFEETPSQFSAQMKLLADTDWILVLDRYPTLDGLDARPSMERVNELNQVAVSLDQQATTAFHPLLENAWRQYRAASMGRTPKTMAELVPFFGPGFDSRILETYTLNGAQIVAHHQYTWGSLAIWGTSGNP